MTRQNRIRVSDHERRLLESIREIKYPNSEPPLGLVIGVVCRWAIAESSPDTADSNETDNIIL